MVKESYCWVLDYVFLLLEVSVNLVLLLVEDNELDVVRDVFEIVIVRSLVYGYFYYMFGIVELYDNYFVKVVKRI